MTTLTVTIDSGDYETMVFNSGENFAAIEPHVHGAVKAAVLRLHARALYLRNLVDGQNGIVRADDGGQPKPPPGP